MEKIKLYIDFDGVILDTIDVSYRMIREKYGDGATSRDSEEFYRNIDWKDFLLSCHPIRQSIVYLNELLYSDLYDVKVLTHVFSDLEKEKKEEYLDSRVPGLEVISVYKPHPKWGAVEVDGAILVDDFSENLREWEEHGGIAIKFSLKDKKYDYYQIKSLEELLVKSDEIIQLKNKKKVKK